MLRKPDSKKEWMLGPKQLFHRGDEETLISYGKFKVKTAIRMAYHGTPFHGILQFHLIGKNQHGEAINVCGEVVVPKTAPLKPAQTPSFEIYAPAPIHEVQNLGLKVAGTETLCTEWVELHSVGRVFGFLTLRDIRDHGNVVKAIQAPLERHVLRVDFKEDPHLESGDYVFMTLSMEDDQGNPLTLGPYGKPIGQPSSRYAYSRTDWAPAESTEHTLTGATYYVKRKRATKRVLPAGTIMLTRNANGKRITVSV